MSCQFLFGVMMLAASLVPGASPSYIPQTILTANWWIHNSHFTMEAILYYWPDFSLYAAEVNLFVNFITAIICWPAMILLVRGRLKPESETLVTKNKNETDLILVYRRLPPKLQAKMTEFGNSVVPELCSDPTESVIITTPGTIQ